MNFARKFEFERSFPEFEQNFFELGIEELARSLMLKRAVVRK